MYINNTNNTNIYMVEQLSVSNYSYKNWKDRFPDGKVKMEEVPIRGTWKKIFKDIRKAEPEKWDELNDILSDCMKFGTQVFPYPDLVFDAFNKTPFEKIKVIVVGQDCYYNEQTVGGKTCPEAMGLSFSVPKEIPIPSSLKNIYANALKNNQFMSPPTHGNLDFWAYQGCLMMNSALTVEKKTPNSHAHLWLWFTDKILEKLSKDREKLVFVFWGSSALERSKQVDSKKHDFVVSSHPSGLSCHTPLKKGLYPAFNNFDHFGKINEFLEKNKQKKIIWQIS